MGVTESARRTHFSVSKLIHQPYGLLCRQRSCKIEVVIQVLAFLEATTVHFRIANLEPHISHTQRWGWSRRRSSGSSS